MKEELDKLQNTMTNTTAAMKLSKKDTQDRLLELENDEEEEIDRLK